MEKLKKILEDINPSIDYDHEKKLIDDHLLDSLNIITLVGEIEDEFDIVIPTVEIIPDNFNSLESLEYLINRLVLNK